MRSAALFDYESDLCVALGSHLARLAARHARIRYQLTVGAEIPDFVVALAPSPAPRITSIESAVLAQLLDGVSLDEASVADRLFTRVERIKTALVHMRRMGLIVGDKCGAWSMTALATEYLKNGRVIAIEAKLTRWQDALAQAASYRRFANLSFVALPMDVVMRRRDALHSDCQETGVGLLSVSASELRIEVAPVSQELRSPDWVWTVMRMGLNEPQRTRGKLSASCVDGSSSFAG